MRSPALESQLSLSNPEPQGTTKEIGDQAEEFAQLLLEEQGYRVQNLNSVRRNHPTVDLRAWGSGVPFECSVKADKRYWQVRLGNGVRKLPDEAWVVAFIPRTHASDLRFAPGGYRLLIIPGRIARVEGLAVHERYFTERPGKKALTPMVRHRGIAQFNRDTFDRWLRDYENRWDLLPAPVEASEHTQGVAL